ncbi:MAG: glycoside hydrolase family 2 TIM barrel-domain containing protein [Lachnospiraceae bacterium]
MQTTERHGNEQMKRADVRLWNDGWEFLELPVEENSYDIPKHGAPVSGAAGEATPEWKPVDIPHDWMIYETHALYRDSIGWYRKEFSLGEPEADEQTVLRFDGVYMDTTVYVNGQEAGEWKYGYSTFEIDMTPYLRAGKNEVHVRVVYRYLNTRWYSGAGIYRNVWLKTRNQTHIASDGIYITPVCLGQNAKEAGNSAWRVEIDTEIEHFRGKEGLVLRQKIVKPCGCELTSCETAVGAGTGSGKLQMTEDGVTVAQELFVEKPVLWDIAKGNLYTLKTGLWCRNASGEEVLLEEQVQRFGFKVMEFKPDEGFLLNGRKVKINGVCEHHDFGCLGSTFHKEAMRRKLLKLREMGVNAVRTSHNMPAPELMELTDELGFLVFSEAFDMWEQSKTTYDYGRFFNEWYDRDVTSWIRRDRNHVSVMMWSIGNEIPDTLKEGRGQEITCNLRDAARRSDPKHHAPITLGSNFMKWENPQQCEDLLECAGYNYSEYLYDEHHKKYPHWVIYGSETASVLASRNIYHFPREKAILSDTDEQCSALGNTITGWGAKSYEACICDDRDATYSIGQFLWTGYDYLGEPTPYQTKNSYFGQIDTAGFEKDAFYIFQSAWTDVKQAPMVHVFPYWDFNEGQIIDVQACTNAPKVELFVNGVSQGVREIDHVAGRELVPLWKVPYVKGEIKAVAYDEQGNVVAEKVRRSFGDTASLKLTAEKQVLSADGEDLAFVAVEALDADGNPVENARNRVHVTVSGAGRLLGLDNGDSADFDEHKGRSRRLFGGKLLAVIGTKKEAGEIKITVSSEGLPESELVLTSKEAPCREGVAASEENRERTLYSGGSQGAPLDNPKEIPVRKIELTCTQSRHLTKVKKEDGTEEIPTVKVEAKIYPENATYRELEWKAIIDTGIEVNFVTVKTEGNTAYVTAEGDGEFRLRCYTKNGGFAESVQSSLEFVAEGIGAAAFDPYEEVPAGLCDYRTERAVEGIEHGINFLGSEDGGKSCIIGFTHVDFGDYGSDKVTLPIFANTNDPVSIALWEGMPGEEGSTLLYDGYYQKPAEWMVFKEETYTLSKRLRGVTSLYIATDASYQLRGFSFEKLNKAYATLYAGENSYVYGDAFEVCKSEDDKTAIEHIGNNVTIGYEHMDFGETGAHRITLESRSPLALSTVQLRFKTEAGEQVQAVQVPGCADYTEHTFTIEPLFGNGTVEFIFMPGSNFDMKWFKFC